ncbi:IclR family transcriptional regulator [Ruegeria jejuensis]|uniref:IclR family transcriptional regulator n=1 Tax=Ruegeria jejuensis TaxID=3233338 RepID=UPI00355B68BE
MIRVDELMNDKSDRTVKEPPQRYSVPALDKALDVLELLSDRAESMSQTDIGRALGRSSSEIFRTLSALETRGYIRRTQAGQFRLTLKLFELSRTHSPYEELLRVAQPIMRALSEEVGETCHLTALREGEIVVLAQVESPKPVRLSVEIGSRHSPLTTTSGRILLASMDDDERDRFLEMETEFPDLPEDIQNTLLTRVRTVQERGYEIADGERFVGGLDIGALVGHPGSTIKASLVVATLRSAQGPDPDRIREAVIATAHKISMTAGLD